MNFDSYLLLLLAIPFSLAYFFLKQKYFTQDKIKYPPLQHSNIKGSRVPWKGINNLLESLIVVFVFLSLSGLHQTVERNSITEEGIDIIFALDVSASMQAADFPPTRLEFLKQITSSFIKKSSGNRIGIYIFAKDTFTQTPMTTDYPILLDLISGISYEMIDHSDSGGTAIGDCLLTAGDTLITNKKEKRDQVIILITDGENSDGVDPILSAKYLKDNDIRLYVVGVAGEEPISVFVNGSPYLTSTGEQLVTSLDDTQLKEIAATAGGRYYRAKDSDVLVAIFEELLTLEKAPLEVKKLYNRIDYSYLFSMPCFFLFILSLAIQFFFIRRPIR
jgi:Ca-activated chloride channel homolog